MSMIALSIVMAITVEGLVELGKSIGKAALDGDRKTAATQLAALIISCALCMAAGGCLRCIGRIVCCPMAWHGSDRHPRVPRLELHCGFC